MRRYEGLTWDHPRGYNALAAAATARQHVDGVDISWRTQPLEGFEAHPIADLCARYDLVVMDHPHVGEAFDAQCLTPLEQVFDDETLRDIASNCIGPSFESYRFADRRWALPLDAAAQVMARRRDLMEGVAAPRTWDDVAALSKSSRKVALSLAGPHAICSFMSMAAAFGDAPAVTDPDVFVSRAIGAKVYELMAELAQRSPASVRDLNPIGILAHMTTQDDVLLCPLIYGYVNYSKPNHGHRLTFTDAPRQSSGSRPGSTLGGTGIGISARCEITAELKRHLIWLMGSDAQTSFFPAHDGQPSRRQSWLNRTVNDRWADFYSNTAETLEQAYVRPRHNGYIAFQSEASAFLREAFDTDAETDKALEGLQALYQRHRPLVGGER